MPKTSVFMGTTQVSAHKSVLAMTQLLVKMGAKQIATEYSPTGQPAGLRFVIEIQKKELAFALPARTEPVYQLLLRQKRTSQTLTKQLRERAERIGWRQLFRWLQAQMALIDLQMVTTHEVFFPYQIDLTQPTRTLFQAYSNDVLPKLLTASA